MHVYEHKDFDWRKPEDFHLWQFVNPPEVRGIALHLKAEFYKTKADVPQENVVENWLWALQEGLNACAAAATIPETAPPRT